MDAGVLIDLKIRRFLASESRFGCFSISEYESWFFISMNTDPYRSGSG
jgi:hypothetical protein